MSRALPLALAAATLAVSPLVASAVPSTPLDDAGSTRIIGGKTSTTPYSFMISYGMGPTFHECGGALISPHWMITARHCVDDAGDFWSQNMMARIGSLDYQGGEKIKINKPVLYPKANGVMFDLALIPLATPAKSTPIPIADSAPVGTRTRIMGWGRTTNASDSSAPRQLQELDTSVVDPSRCAGDKPEFLVGKELCTDNPGGNAGAYKGDSGGPQISWVNNQWHLVGVTSRGPEKGGSAPSIYTDVTHYKDWIAKVMAGQKP